jgi:hypothetical protein
MKNKFWFYSLILVGLVVLICNSCKKEKDSPSNLVKDIDGNVYDTVTVGTQTWMVENLKTTRYNDGTAIPLVTKSVAWETLSTPGYCWYNNDESTYKAPYGALYNWYTVNTGKLCPTGWHVPGDSEWIVLIDFLGGPELTRSLKKLAQVIGLIPMRLIPMRTQQTNRVLQRFLVENVASLVNTITLAVMVTGGVLPRGTMTMPGAGALMLMASGLAPTTALSKTGFQFVA